MYDESNRTSLPLHLCFHVQVYTLQSFSYVSDQACEPYPFHETSPQVDVIANSIKPKTSLNEDVLRTSTGGSLAPQFAERCGQGLIDDLSSSNRACWETGVLQFTDSYEMDCGEGSPAKVIHFCLPSSWNGSNTYQVCTWLMVFFLWNPKCIT